MRRIRYKVEELSPGNYMVWDREASLSVMKTGDLMQACELCAMLRMMNGERDVLPAEAMYIYTQQRN